MKFVGLAAISLIASVGICKDMTYVEAPSLAQNISVQVETCPATDTMQVPIITWGGDIATIFANGSLADTAPASLFGKAGLKVRLAREDVLGNQIKSYMACKSPFLRGTLSMVRMASEVLSKDSRTKPVVIYQMTWSAGGDALVVKSNIRTAADLKGKTIALQAYGPHVDYLGKILSDAGLKTSDVKIKWVKDLTGSAQSPMNALYQSDVDAVFVIMPDALKLTSNGTVGTGAEDSVKGAKVLLSTKTASRIIADVYAVRSDYFNANKAQIHKFVQSLMKAQEEFLALAKAKASRKDEFKKVMAGSAKLLLDSEQAANDAEGMVGDAHFASFADNLKFFTDKNFPRSFSVLNSEIRDTLAGLGLISKASQDLAAAGWDFAGLKSDLKTVTESTAPKFNTQAVSQAATKMANESGLFSFEVKFKPNQNTFSSQEYAPYFKKAVELSATYAGAVITIEGHSDPLGYLKKKKEGENPLVLSRIKQSAKNLSLTRANAVRDSLLAFAKSRGITVDPSQFAVVGHGIEKPKNGLCGSDPCPPENEQAWLSNMRVEFKIIQVEAEENVFQGL